MLWRAFLSATEGDKRIYIQCRDGAGHEVDGTATAIIYYDPTPPVASFIEINDGDEYTNDRNVQLTWAYTGDATKAIVSNESDFDPFQERDPDV